MGNLTQWKVKQNFWLRVNKTETCWLWTGLTRRSGGGALYGAMRFEGPFQSAHRISYKMAYGKFDETLCVLHKCDVSLCVRPDHLYLGTQRDNNLDAFRRGRRKVFKLTPDQLTTLKEKYSAGVSSRNLAKEFGCSHTTILYIVNH